jgi:hypothetical protein
VRLAHRHRAEAPQQFVEGEPELEPPEELAVEVVDENALLRDDVGCELVDESDLERQWADETFEELVHADDAAEDSDLLDAPADDTTDRSGTGEAVCWSCHLVLPARSFADPITRLCRRCSR